MGHYTARFDETCDVIVSRVQESLERHGIRVLPTFDLQAVCDCNTLCPCPYHGASACGCQYVVFLAYGPDAEMGSPRVIAAHGHDNQTWLSLLRGAEVPDRRRTGHQIFDTMLMDAIAEASVKPELAE